MGHRERRRVGEGALQDDEAIDRRALALFEDGHDWLSALAQAVDGVGTHRVGAPGKRSRTAELPPQRIMRKADGDALDEGTFGIGALLGGDALPAPLRAELEAALGFDLGEVRVHTGADADDAARNLGARAFAVGRDIGFRAGAYDPTTPEGVRLIAHEVAHTTQAPIAARPGAAVSTSDEAGEREADAFAERFVARRPTPAIAPRPMRALPEPAAAPRLKPAAASVAPPIPPPSSLGHGRIESMLHVLRAAIRRMTATPPELAAAIELLEKVKRFLDGLVEGDRVRRCLRAHGINVHFATELIGHARGAVDAILRRARAGVTSAPLAAADLVRVEAAREYLEILAGDRGVDESPLVADVDNAQLIAGEVGRFALHMTPIIGSLIMLGEAAVGTSILGRDLSPFERALLGGGALLAEVATIARGVRMVVAATRLAKVAGIGRAQALRLVLTGRNLTPHEAAELMRLANKVRAGEALVEAESTVVNRILVKLGESTRVADAYAQATMEVGALAAGRFYNLSREAIEVVEQEAAEILARELQAVVLRPAKTALKGGKNPDYVINDLVAELVAPLTGSIDAFITKVATKHAQAGIVVVSMARTTLTAPEFIAQIGRLWGKSNFADVSRVIVIAEGKIAAQLLPPASAAAVLAPAAVRATASVGTQMSTEDEGEADEQGPPAPQNE